MGQSVSFPKRPFQALFANTPVQGCSHRDRLFDTIRKPCMVERQMSPKRGVKAAI